MTNIIATLMVVMMVLGVVGLIKACMMAGDDQKRKQAIRQEELSISRNRKIREEREKG